MRSRPRGASFRLISALVVAALALVGEPVAGAAGWLDGDDATGTWGGARTWLEDHGVHLDLDYSAEVFTLPADDEAAYRGNADLMLTLDTEKLGLWSCGSLFVYGQSAHGHGVSDELAPIMTVSNLEAPAFTQLSELWLEQCLGAHVVLRLGKQDANRDFAGPRFGGNFLNAAFGVVPEAPMPSFPAPGVGAAVLGQVTDAVGARAAVYEGAPTIRSFGEDAFDDGAGVFAVAALVVEHDLFGQRSGRHQLGAWTHTGEERSGVFGVVDFLVKKRPDVASDTRSVQVFARAGASERAPGAVHLYVGGGVTLHGFAGEHNTFGVGAGHARADDHHETFVELFFKLRPVAWLTLEPDCQVYFLEQGDTPRLAAGLRVKLKL